MADISTQAPITLRRSNVRQPVVPALKLGSSLAAMVRLVAGAFTMAYVDPYAGHGRPPQAAPDDDLQGRDPDW